MTKLKNDGIICLIKHQRRFDPMDMPYPECSACMSDGAERDQSKCETAYCVGKRNEAYRKEIEKLNKLCIGCPDNGRNPDRCQYHCQVGFKIHKYDCLMGNGNHSRW